MREKVEIGSNISKPIYAQRLRNRKQIFKKVHCFVNGDLQKVKLEVRTQVADISRRETKLQQSKFQIWLEQTLQAPNAGYLI